MLYHNSGIAIIFSVFEPDAIISTQRHISARPPPPPEKKGFFHSIIDNIRQEISRNKELKENLQHFRKEAAKLEESEALKKAREKYVSDVILSFNLIFILRYSWLRTL